MNQPQTPQLHIVFDLDEVLAAFNVAMCETIVRMTGNPEYADDHKWRWTTYEVAHLYPEIERFDDVFHTMEAEGIMVSLQPIAPMVELINAAHSRGVYITILTARGWMADAQGVTSTWLAEHGIQYDELIISDHKKSKVDYMPADVDLYIDDNSDHATTCAPHVESVILAAYPWNHDCVLSENMLRLGVDDISAKVQDWLAYVDEVYA